MKMRKLFSILMTSLLVLGVALPFGGKANADAASDASNRALIWLKSPAGCNSGVCF